MPVTPKGRSPLTVMRMVFGRFCHSACVAMTWATSEEPMPKAMAPTAPCVEVWLSPQTITRPGCVKPCSGPTTWMMPWRASSTGKWVIPLAVKFSPKTRKMRLMSSVARSSMRRLVVGT